MRRLAVLLLAGCATSPTEMRVAAEPRAYAASMSSTIGLGLTPIAEPPRGVKVRYHWSASSGYFLAWSESTHVISNRGAETMTESGKLFWSYDPNEAAAAGKKPVTIVIVARDVSDGKVLVRTDVLLVWDGDLIRVAH